MKYRKKPIVIEAWIVGQVLNLAQHAWDELPQWLQDAYDAGNIVFARDGVHIKTLEGNIFGGRYDWIIQGIQGEIYPCKDDIFQATYEPVEDPTP